MKGLLPLAALVILIIAVAVFSLLFVFLKEVGEYSLSQTELEKCRIEVVRASELGNLPADRIKKGFVYAKCPANNFIVESADEKQLSVILAKEMRDCWYKLGEGKMNPFPGQFVDQHVACYPCSNFRVSDDYSMNKPLNTYFDINKDREEFLKDAFIKKGDERVFELVSIDKEDNKISEINESELSLEAGKTYYLMNLFVLDKEARGFGWIKVINAISGFTTTDTYSKLAFVEAGNINDVCASLEG